MADKKGQKRRVWSVDEKRSICAQARVSGVSVAHVARRYSMNTNLIHKWLRDPRLSPEDPDMGLPEGEEAAFFPIEVAGVSSTPMARFSPPVSSGLVTAQRVDIALSDGRRILVEGTTALSAVLALVEGLTA